MLANSTTNEMQKLIDPFTNGVEQDVEKIEYIVEELDYSFIKECNEVSKLKSLLVVLR